MSIQYLTAILFMNRPKIFDLQIQRPDLLYEHVCEMDERVLLVKGDSPCAEGREVVQGVSSERLCVEKALEEVEVVKALTEIVEKGIRY